MHIQFVTYRVADTSETEFIEANREFASAMAAVPGLLAKVWLKAPESRYGGFYLWEDKGAYERFLAGELWAEVLEDESMMDLVSQDFEVMDELTTATQPRIKLV